MVTVEKYYCYLRFLILLFLVQKRLIKCKDRTEQQVTLLMLTFRSEHYIVPPISYMSAEIVTMLEMEKESV
jgi:hypothetical protein